MYTVIQWSQQKRKQGHKDDIKLPRQLNPHDLYNLVLCFFLPNPTQTQLLRFLLLLLFILGINISQQNYFFLLQLLHAYFVIILGNPTT